MRKNLINRYCYFLWKIFLVVYFKLLVTQESVFSAIWRISQPLNGFLHGVGHSGFHHGLPHLGVGVRDGVVPHGDLRTVVIAHRVVQGQVLPESSGQTRRTLSSGQYDRTLRSTGNWSLVQLIEFCCYIIDVFNRSLGEQFKLGRLTWISFRGLSVRWKFHPLPSDSFNSGTKSFTMNEMEVYNFWIIIPYIFNSRSHLKS